MSETRARPGATPHLLHHRRACVPPHDGCHQPGKGKKSNGDDDRGNDHLCDGEAGPIPKSATSLHGYWVLAKPDAWRFTWRVLPSRKRVYVDAPVMAGPNAANFTVSGAPWKTTPFGSV